MSLLGFIFDLGTDLIHGYSETVSALSSHKSDFNKLFNGDAISVEQFNRLYDIRMYNINNERNDIKFLKYKDEPGVYVLNNISKGRCFVGRSDKVFRKVYRQINGRDRIDISAGDELEIHVYTLSRTNRTNLNELEKEVTEAFQMIR